MPRRQLTPGAVRSVAKSDVCAGSFQQAFVVPVALQRRVFEEYGIRNARPDAYEVDYLITPELGGAADIRNLWPEPYSATVWNAHVKDALEDRLHRMVCDGDSIWQPPSMISQPIGSQLIKNTSIPTCPSLSMRPN